MCVCGIVAVRNEIYMFVCWASLDIEQSVSLVSLGIALRKAVDATDI